MRPLEPPTGHVDRRDGKRRSTWYAKYRLPDGRQVQKRVGPAWTERGRPPAGRYTERTAEAWLRAVLDEARRGTLPGLVQTGATFADAAAEFLRYVEHDRSVKPSTLTDYRSIVSAHLVPAFGAMRIEDVTPEKIDAGARRSPLRTARPCRTARRTSSSCSSTASSVVPGRSTACRSTRSRRSSAIRSARAATSRSSSVEEVYALARAANSEQDAAIYLTAAFTGLRRGELVALRWRDVDFAASTIRVRASYAGGALTTPKSGRVRSVPMSPDVAETLAQVGQRGHATRDDDLVFLGDAGGHLDASALRRRYDRALTRAGLRPLRFHDLRHTFGTRMIARADIRRVQEWMGHADVQTTMRYLHYAPRHDDAALVADAFRRDGLSEARSTSEASG
jgi:integrase